MKPPSTSARTSWNAAWGQKHLDDSLAVVRSAGDDKPVRQRVELDAVDRQVAPVGVVGAGE